MFYVNACFLDILLYEYSLKLVLKGKTGDVFQHLIAL